jgi:hypothetical protein
MDHCKDEYGIDIHPVEVPIVAEQQLPDLAEGLAPLRHEWTAAWVLG